MFIVTIAGHLGKDPETRFTSNGQKVTSFSIAVNQRKGKEEITTWVRVTVWGDSLDKMISYLKKGSGVIITGKMNPPTTYVDKEGRTQIALEVTAEMIDFNPFGRSDKQQGEGQGNPGQREEGQYQAQRAPQQQSMNTQYNAPNPQYNQTAGQPNYSHSSHTTGQGSHSHSADEDENLPF